MKSLRNRFLLIGALTACGIWAMWPPREKLKLGIDLSGGTILVYQVDRSNLSRGFDMDELIAALKRRVNPSGVKDTTIRRVGADRVEIIMPEATVEDVEEVKRSVTDVGALEFRIL